jgi:hypothetical protein
VDNIIINNNKVLKKQPQNLNKQHQCNPQIQQQILNTNIKPYTHTTHTKKPNTNRKQKEEERKRRTKQRQERKISTAAFRLRSELVVRFFWNFGIYIHIQRGLESIIG